MKENAKTEEEMREADVPWPETEKELMEYINSLVERGHNYGTCVYAMSMAAVAAYYYVSSKLGVTGFQASCADLDFIRRTRGFEGPFAIIDGGKMLYPQYDLIEDLKEMMKGWSKYIQEKARENLENMDNSPVASHVVEHWKKLAETGLTTED